MSFTWTDRHGVTHELERHDPISLEAAEIEREVDRALPLIESDDGSMRDTARRAIAPLIERLTTLEDDLRSWNAYAHERNKLAAAELAEKIDGLPAAIAAVQLVVDLHQEHDDMLKGTANDADARKQRLTGPLTQCQRKAIAAAASRHPPSDDLTREEAAQWLDRQPAFARRRDDDGGWFFWTDNSGQVQSLVDPLSIEKEVVTVVNHLLVLRPELDNQQQDKLYEKIIEAHVLLKRIVILKHDLDRFNSDALANDLTNCKTFAKTWRERKQTS